MHRFNATAQLHAIETAKARAVYVIEAVDHGFGGKRLVVPGMVEQAGRYVHSVAKNVARYLHDFAHRQPDLQF